MDVADAVTVVIADDHAPTRAAVRGALERDGFVVCGEAADAAGAVAAVAEVAPQVALLDIRMPGDGVTAASAITAAGAGVSIVMLTVSEDDEDLFGALRAGAVGYLLKGMDPERLPPALRSILQGEAVLPGRLVARLLTEFRARERRRFLRDPSPSGAKLSRREWEVLDLMETGLSTAEIAARLYVAPVTVRSHIANILRKLQVPDRDAAIKLLQQTAGPRRGTARSGG